MYITIPRKQKKVTTLKNLWDIRFDEATNKITVSDEAYDRLDLKDNNFILAVNPEDNKDVALQISAEITDDSFYVTQAGAKRAKNKSFKDEILSNYLKNIGGTEFTLVHTTDNYYKIYTKEEITNNLNTLDLVNELNMAEDSGTLYPKSPEPEPVIDEQPIAVEEETTPFPF
jgi:hypothetical protein